MFNNITKANAKEKEKEEIIYIYIHTTDRMQEIKGFFQTDSFSSNIEGSILWKSNGIQQPSN